MCSDDLKEIMSIEEDTYLSLLAEKAEKECEGKPLIPSSEVWRKFGLDQ